MKAIRVHRFGPPEVLQLEEVATPAPGPGEVLVRIKAAGVNPVDTYIRSGTYALKPQLPYTPGTDGAGVVESWGAGVSGWKRGDRVYLSGAISGTYAGYALVGWQQIYALSERLNFSQGAGVHVPYFTAYDALAEVAHAQPGETVLVHGASGGVGIAAVQIARAAGLRVIGTASSEKGRELVKKEGAQEALDHNDPNHFARVLELSGGKGADIVIEMLANVNLANDLKILAPQGRVVVVGSRGDVQITPRDLMSRHGAILGVMLWGVPPAQLARIQAALAAGFDNGTLRPVVGAEYPLAESVRAHKEVMDHSGGSLGKIVLLP
jgi:NADPH:quinone reductase